MKRIIALLSLFLASAIANRDDPIVKKIILEVNRQYGCGGGYVTISLTHPRNNLHYGICSLSSKLESSQNRKLVWRTDNELRNCKNQAITDSMRVNVRSGRQLCPGFVRVVASNGAIFRASIPAGPNNQQSAYPLTKLKGPGVKEISMANGPWDNCSGRKVKVKIVDPRTNKHCEVEPKDEVVANSIAHWSGAELNDCASMNVDMNSQVYFMTTAVRDDGTDGGFCPERTTIRMRDEVNTLWEAYGRITDFNFFTTATNDVGHGLLKYWPLPEGIWVRPVSLPLICPADDDNDTCEAKDMHAYKIAARQKMNCIFECHTLKSVVRSTDYVVTNATGFRCLEVDYESVQFDWCCKTKRVGGIPYCPDVSGFSQQVTATTIAPVMEYEPDQDGCPISGCPIDHVNAYFDRNDPKVMEACEVSYECDFVKSADGNDPNSGVVCTASRRPKRKLSVCCDDPNAVSELPQCSARGQPRQPAPVAQPQDATSPETTFQCPGFNGIQVLPLSLVCDGIQNCGDNSDETNCTNAN